MTVRRRIKFDAQLWSAVDRLCLDAGKNIDEVADEAFRDLLKKRLALLASAKLCEKARGCSPPIAMGGVKRQCIICGAMVDRLFQGYRRRVP